MNTGTHASQAWVDLGAYRHNLRIARELAGPRCEQMAVVKANGYGLGALSLARTALESGASMLGVATVDEALELRSGGIDAPILLLIQPSPEAFPLLISEGITPLLCDSTAGRQLGELARVAGRIFTIHAMIDTGMNRQGFAPEEAIRALPELARHSHLNLEGVATHFPTADVPDDPFTRGQIQRLKGVLEALDAAGTPYDLVHGSNSAGIVNYGDPIFNLARPGIMCFGVWPTINGPRQNPLRPVLRWVTRVSQVRTLVPGDTVSYGRTYTVASPMTAAMIPVGYADGYRLALSNRAEVLIRGRRCPVRGRVCMDQFVVDASQVPGVAPGDEVVLVGVQGEDEITLDELAAHASTIPYEILTGIGRRVPRLYTGVTAAVAGKG